jgi:uncharacterized short protein YbdD (DUF466 family)
VKAQGNSLREVLKKLWWGYRQMSGDAAYDLYVQHWRRRCPAEEPQVLLTRQEFYLERIQQRYRTPSRCC